MSKFKLISVDKLIKQLDKYTFKQLHIHHTWKPSHKDFDGKNHVSLQQGMYNYHVNQLKWSDIGQHVTLMPDGWFVTGRDFFKSPASIKGWNTGAFAVEMLGNFDIGNEILEGKQKENILKLARYFAKRFGKDSIKFHREGPNVFKTCPGTSINKNNFIKEMEGGRKMELIDKIKAVQKGIGAYPDGKPGPQTWDCLYRKFADVSYPYAEKFFGGCVIYCKDIGIRYVQNKKTCRNYENSISGTFQWKNNAVSVLIADGKVINNSSSHAWLKQPETIVYKTKQGVLNSIRALCIPDNLINEIDWAISGLGLHNYNPSKEGFKGRYSDVLRRTGHTGIGITQNNEIALLYKKCNGSQFADWAINKLGLKFSIMLDGGHIAAVNTSDYKYNTNQLQNNIIQAIG